MRFLNQVALSLLLLIGSPGLAHQAKFIDITNTTLRLELRYLTAAPVENGYGGGYVIGGIPRKCVTSRDVTDVFTRW